MNRLGIDQISGSWDDAARSYDEGFVPFTSQFAEMALSMAAIVKGEKVLDVAAGSGALTMAAARMGADVLGTDFSPAMIGLLRGKIADSGLNARAEVMDGQNLNIDEGIFDAAFSCFGLIFFPDLDKGFAELFRAIRPGGRAAVICWGDIARFELMNVIMQSLKKTIPGFAPPDDIPAWYRISSPEIMENHFRRAGFRDVRTCVMAGDHIADGPEPIWKFAVNGSPPLKDLFEKIGPEKSNEVGENMRSILRNRFSDGVVRLSAEAIIGLGYK